MCGTPNPESSNKMNWTCPQCTYINSSNRSRCEICNNLRPGYKPMESKQTPIIFANEKHKTPEELSRVWMKKHMKDKFDIPWFVSKLDIDYVNPLLNSYLHIINNKNNFLYIISYCMVLPNIDVWLMNIDTNSTLTLIEQEMRSAKAYGIGYLLSQKNTLTELFLNKNRIGWRGGAAIAKGLKCNSTLRRLELQGNNLKNAGAKAIGDVLKINNTLNTLNLGGNKIKDEGAIALGRALETNYCLECLSLWKNQIGDSGARALGKGLIGNTILINLDLHDNKIGNEGAQAISGGLGKNVNLLHLNLSLNRIKDNGALALASGIKSNSTLVSLTLFISYTSHHVARNELELAVKNHPSIVKYKL